MNNIITPALRQAMLLLLLLPTLLLSACSDECETTVTYTIQEPVYMLRQDLRTAVKTSSARVMEQPGKIYVKGQYLFINEMNKGIHIINNANPAAPKAISFIEIPGNIDLAVKGNILYADSHIDLVALDISDPLNVKLLKRVENVFPTYGMIVNDTASVFVAGFTEKVVTESINANCNGSGYSPRPWVDFMAPGNKSTNSFAGVPNATGKGGSMARFTITGNHLYTVSISSLQLFDISRPDEPQKGNTIPIGWGIETIFPYGDKLFIGSTTGMHIYDNTNPSAPTHLSTYAHVNSCDPVVVDGKYAWVTLRSGNTCAGAVNQLDLLDISDARFPKLLKTYPMQNPHGLGIDRSTLFLCEGKYGLKIFDIKDPLKVNNNQLGAFNNHDAFDVIPMNGILMLIGQDGLYQYDYSDVGKMKLLSKIPVSR